MAQSGTQRPGAVSWLTVFFLLFVALVIWVLGIFQFVGLLEAPEHRAMMPGTLRMTLNETGGYQVFLEHRSVIDGQYFSGPTSLPNQTVVGVTKTDGTASVDVLPAGHFNQTYEIGSYAGEVMYTFEIDQPGDYTLLAQSPAGAPPYVLAVKSGSAGQFTAGLLSVFGACGLGALFAIAGVVFLIITIARAVAAKKSEPAPRRG